MNGCFCFLSLVPDHTSCNCCLLCRTTRSLDPCRVRVPPKSVLQYNNPCNAPPPPPGSPPSACTWPLFQSLHPSPLLAGPASLCPPTVPQVNHITTYSCRLYLCRGYGNVCRWLALHNSTLSVREVIEQINRPAEKASYEAAASTNSTSLYGSTENFVQYLKFGMFWADHQNLVAPVCS